MAAGMPQDTCASVSAPVVLVSPGKSSQESRLTGSVWQQQRSQTPAATVPKSGAHRMGCGMVGRKRRKIIHSPWINAKVFKTTQHPHTSSPALPGIQSRFSAAHENGTDENAYECHSSSSFMSRNWAARIGFKLKKYSGFNRRSLCVQFSLAPSV